MDESIKKRAEGEKLSKFSGIADAAIASPNAIFDILPGPDFMDKDENGNIKDDMAADKPVEEKLGGGGGESATNIKHKSTFGLGESTIGGQPDVEDLVD